MLGYFIKFSYSTVLFLVIFLINFSSKILSLSYTSKFLNESIYSSTLGSPSRQFVYISVSSSLLNSIVSFSISQTSPHNKGSILDSILFWSLSLKFWFIFLQFSCKYLSAFSPFSLNFLEINKSIFVLLILMVIIPGKIYPGLLYFIEWISSKNIDLFS